MARKDDEVSQQTADAVGAMSGAQLLEALKMVIEGSRVQSDPAMMAIAQSLKVQAEIDEQRFRKENAVSPKISAYSWPEGDEARPKPSLDSVTIFSNALQQEDQLMPIEIILFNKIKSNKSARKGKWQAIYEPPLGDARRGKLTVSLGVNLNSPDSVTDIPPLVQILAELGTGADATNVALLFQQLEELKSKVAGYEQQQLEELHTNKAGYELKAAGA